MKSKQSIENMESNNNYEYNSLLKITMDKIKSNYIKEYLKKENHKFSIKEQIAIILNSDSDIVTKKQNLMRFKVSQLVKDTLAVNEYDELKKIVSRLNVIIKYAYDKTDDIILVAKIKDRLLCAKNIDNIIRKINDDDELSTEVSDGLAVEIHNIYTVTQIGCMKVDVKNNKILEASTVDDIDSELYNTFIDVPSNIHMGDVVKTVGSDDEYIVINEPMQYSEFKSELTYNDSFIAVINKDILDSDKDYKKQIEEIYVNRINNIDNPLVRSDIIMDNYVTLNILEVEKEVN